MTITPGTPCELPCPVCSQPLAIRLARGRKSGKPFVMVLCSVDARHFRGFISHRPYVREVLDALETQHSSEPQAA